MATFLKSKLVGVSAVAVAAALAVLPGSAVAQASPQAVEASTAAVDTSDDALVRRLPGFRNATATVNGIRLHYVIGGAGPPLVLLPGHPETWWGYNKIMPTLARDFTVIAVDIRGMGSSDKPQGGYDKKTMAGDVHALVSQLGYAQVNMTGHDIGAMVAQSFAHNFPQATRKLALLDVAHANETFYEARLLPEEGKFGRKIDAEHPPYTWWFGMHQVPELTQRMLANGGMALYIEYLMNYMVNDIRRHSALDLKVQQNAYASPDAIRAGHEWYRAFPRDINDYKTYGSLPMPVLAIGAEHTGYHWLQVVKEKAPNFELVKLEDSGHFVQIEQPERVAHMLSAFFRK